jgi:hypothetical protein
MNYRVSKRGNEFFIEKFSRKWFQLNKKWNIIRISEDNLTLRFFSEPEALFWVQFLESDLDYYTWRVLYWMRESVKAHQRSIF